MNHRGNFDIRILNAGDSNISQAPRAPNAISPMQESVCIVWSIGTSLKALYVKLNAKIKQSGIQNFLIGNRLRITGQIK